MLGVVWNIYQSQHSFFSIFVSFKTSLPTVRRSTFCEPQQENTVKYMDDLFYTYMYDKDRLLAQFINVFH